MNDFLEQNGGFSIVEIIVAVGFLAIIVTALTAVLFYGEETTALSGNRSRAVFLAEEGLEATRNIRDAAYTNLADGTYGLATTGNIWVFSGTSDTSGIFTRQITIGFGGTNRKVATSTVTWQQNLQRSGSVSATTELTNWKQAVSGLGGGMLVYGNGGTTADAINYKILSSSGTWSSPASSAADIDGGSTNRALRAASVYASSTRNEKVLLSRHYNGTTQYIYGQVYNGTTWGNVQLLSSWNAATFLDVKNFSGTYLNNGDFMAVYSDNTTTPKFRIWNGSTWSAASISMQALSGIPNFIVAKARPATNEVMAATFDQALDTNTQYFNNSSGYTTASWTLHAVHAVNAPINTKDILDFDWSPNNPLIGAMVYSANTTDRRLTIRIWTANGTGSGAWSAVANDANQGVGGTRVGAEDVAARPTGATEFLACDDNTVPQVVCNTSSSVPAWGANTIIAAATDAGIQRTFDTAFEQLGGIHAIGVYSDATTTPKLKKYTASTSTWDSTATNLNVLGAALKSVTAVPREGSDDIMLVLGDNARNLYTMVWDGSADNIYTTPTGKAFNNHSALGSAVTEYWYDFAWDRF